MTTDDIIDGILNSEGGFTNNPNDAGGATNRGITQRELAAWRGYPVTVEDVRALGEPETRLIYRDVYVVLPRFLQLPDPLRYVVVDWGVISGPARASIGLQLALGVPADGIVGRQTMSAVLRTGAISAAMLTCAKEVQYLGRLVTRKPSQAVFAEGWSNRLAEKIRMVQGETA